MAEARPPPLLGLGLGLDLAKLQLDEQTESISSAAPSLLGAPIELVSSKPPPPTVPKATSKPVFPSSSGASAAQRVAQTSRPLSSSAFLTPSSPFRSPSAVSSTSDEPSYFIQTISPEATRSSSSSLTTSLAVASAPAETPAVRPAPSSVRAPPPAFRRPVPGRPQPKAARRLDVDTPDHTDDFVTPQKPTRASLTPLASLLSPGVDLDFADVSPAMSLKDKKKRKVEQARRGFTGLDSPGPGPLEVAGGGAFKNHGGPDPTEFASPGISSPTAEPEKTGKWLGPSIGLAVSLGLIVIGVTAWAGYRHRRRAGAEEGTSRSSSSSKRHEGDSHDRDGDDEEKAIGTPRVNSALSITTFRPMSSMYDSPSTPDQAPLPSAPARVAVLNTPEPRESLVMNGARIQSPSPPPRSSPYYERVRSSLNGEDFALPDGLDAIVEEEADVAELRSHAPAPSIVDEVTEHSPRLASPIAPNKRCSNSSFLSIDSDRSSCYTTASSGESVGDLSAVTITDSMPTTPRIGSFADQQALSSDATLRNQTSASTLGSDVPAPRSRMRAKTVTSAQPVVVKVRGHPHKTHSLQAQAGTSEALKAATWAEASIELGNITWNADRTCGLREITAVNGLDNPFEEETVMSKGKGKQRESFGSPIKRPGNPLVKQINTSTSASACANTTPRVEAWDRDQENCTNPTNAESTPGRRQTFPAELLSRRQSKALSAAAERPVRKSEMLGREYFKNTLRAVRGEASTESGSGSPFGSPSSPSLGAAVDNFNTEIAAQQSQLERYMHEIDKRHSVESIGSPRRNLVGPGRGSTSTGVGASIDITTSPERTALANFSSFAWDSYDDTYDSYYLDRIADPSDDEYEDVGGYTPQPGSTLPSIQITRH